MQWFRPLSILIIVLTFSISVNGTWQPGQEYNYKVHTKTLTASKDGRWNGAVFQSRLTIWPKSNDVLIGKLRRPQYATMRSDADVTNLKYNDLTIEQPFEVSSENGVVKSLLVDRKLSEDQIDQLMSIVEAAISQLHVDRNVQYLMDNGFYNTVEQTMWGNCETNYEISPLAEYVAKSRSDLVPLPERRGHGQFIDIVKSRDYNKCNEKVAARTEVTRIILSGSHTNYTVQASMLTMKAPGPPNIISYVNITLESVDADTTYPPIHVDAPLDVVNNYSPRTSHKKVGDSMERIGLTYPDENGSTQYTPCYSEFPGFSMDKACYAYFGPEWAGVEIGKTCGFMTALGKEILCRRKYPLCEQTECFSNFNLYVCNSVFRGRLDVQRGELFHCPQGAARYRCCAN